MFSATLTMSLSLIGPLVEPPIFGSGAMGNKEHPGHATTEVRTDVGWVGPSQTFHVLVTITPDKGWHVYWKNPGASGAPTEFELEVPKGFVVGEPLFPRPTIFQSAEGATYGYNTQATIFIPVTAPEVLVDGQVDFTVTTFWLSCKKNCVMGEQTRSLKVSTNAHQSGAMHRDMQLVHWQRALPRPLDDVEGGTCSVVGITLHISGETDIRPIRFIGVERKGIRFGTPSNLVFEGDAFRLPIPIFLDFSATDDHPIIIEGLLLLGRKSDDPTYVVHIEVDKTHVQHESKGN